MWLINYFWDILNSLGTQSYLPHSFFNSQPAFRQQPEAVNRARL